MKKILLLLTLIFLLTGCFEEKTEFLNVGVTNYANEFITKQLYKENSNITSIYPDGINISTYKTSDKQKQDFAKKDIFIYNGLIEKERDLAVELLDINPSLKIIDSAYILNTEYAPEELWLNPSSFLMMTQNIKNGLKEYIDSSYTTEEIDKNYEQLKVTLSEMDAEFRLNFDNSSSKTIVVGNTALEYLEIFDLDVICLDGDATKKTISDVEKLIKNNSISYIYTFKDEKLSEEAEALLNNNSNFNRIELNKLDNLTDDQRKTNEDYLSLSKDNLEILKKELY